MKGLKTLTILVALLSLSACGDKDSGSTSDSGDGTQEVVDSDLVPTEPQPLEGQYEAILRPLNTSVSGFIPSGKALFQATEAGLTVTSYLEDDSKVQHIQSVHVGTRCPTMKDDANGDGFVDTVEMAKSVGKVLLALDADLNSLSAGQDSHPVGNAYTYVKEARVNDMLNDLYTNDKLPAGSPLNLAGRVVVVHGTSDITRVPESVQTVNGLARNVTIPITCGIIKRR